MKKEEVAYYIKELKDIAKKCDSLNNFIFEVNRSGRIMEYARALMKTNYGSFKNFYKMEKQND